LDSCSAALAGLGVDVGATAANTAAEAVLAQTAANAANLALTQVSLDATALASAAAVAPAELALAAAQLALDLADGFILVDGMRDIQEAIFAGFINPGELSISRLISVEDSANPDADTDSAVFSGNLADYTISGGGRIIPADAVTDPPARTDGFTEVTDIRAVPVDGRDLVRNIERLVFADLTVVLDTVAPVNSVALGLPTISGTTAVGDILTASIAGVTDADNPGAITSPVLWTWQSEPVAGEGFTDIERLLGGGDPFSVTGENLELTAADAGQNVRVVGIFQDGELAFERVISAPVIIDAAVNRAPVANPDAAAAFENTPVVINVLSNDVDPDGDGMASQRSVLR
jgi:hypothetical protein